MKKENFGFSISSIHFFMEGHIGCGYQSFFLGGGKLRLDPPRGCFKSVKFSFLGKNGEKMSKKMDFSAT